MPKDPEKQRTRVPINVLEQDFNKAIDRLLNGKPHNPVLRLQFAQGRLVICVSTVAKEAKRSRTLIALQNCRLPAVRDRILLLQRKGEKTVTLNGAGVAAKLRTEIEELKRDLGAAIEMQAVHFELRGRAEGEAAKWRDAYRREVEGYAESKKVTPIRRR